MSAALPFSTRLIQKYDLSGPRYTSYPTALEFSADIDNSAFKAAALTRTGNFSLYVHIPFCHKLCYYCGCNKVVSNSSDRAQRYLTSLRQEINARAKLFRGRRVQHLHLGGGTPSYLTQTQMSELISALREAFDFVDDAELGIEIDAREVDEGYLSHLYSLGFNRLSIGVQDTDSQVQEAINRPQSTQHIANLVVAAKTLGFKSVSVDLIYGLPRQTERTFSQTLEDVLAMSVDRVSLFSYAHMPSRFKAQRLIASNELPDAQLKLTLMALAITKLTEAGMVEIGMDHFAKPEDELAIAAQSGRLTRNFQGYSDHGAIDLLGLGVSAISQVGAVICQNMKELAGYHEAVAKMDVAVERGVVLSSEDELRGAVIQAIMCQHKVDKTAIAQAFGIDFDDYFSAELLQLAELEKDGLLTLEPECIRIWFEHRLLVRRVAMVFDAYLPEQVTQRFSRII